MPRVTRQIRIDEPLEVRIQQIAEKEGRTFSNCSNWLLTQAVAAYCEQHPELAKSDD